MLSGVERSAVAFAADGVGRFGVDRLVLTCRPRGIQPPAKLIPRLAGEKLVKHARGLSALIEVPGYALMQQLGHAGGGVGDVSCRVVVNVLRRVRDRLVAVGKYRCSRRPNLMGDNFIDPATVDADVDIRAESVADVLRVVADVRLLYVETLERLFGLLADPKAVAVSVNEIELAWDVSCASAVWAPKLWWRSWADSFLNAHTGRGPNLAGLTSVHQSFGLSTEDLSSLSGCLVLHGQRAKNERFKLYPKHERVLRYEATFDGERASARLGAPIRLGDHRNLDHDLTKLARLAYEPLMSVRQDLLDPREFSPSAVWVALAKAGRRPDKTCSIFDAFVAGNVFHNPDERFSRELTRLRRMGLVRLVGKGLWAPSGALRRYLSKLHLVWTHPDSADDPTGRGTSRGTRPAVVFGLRGASTQRAPQDPQLPSRSNTRHVATRGEARPTRPPAQE
jgi:hypothetical protein